MKKVFSFLFNDSKMDLFMIIWFKTCFISFSENSSFICSYLWVSIMKLITRRHILLFMGMQFYSDSKYSRKFCGFLKKC